jgi:23S rRNA (uracil1939-C5)-methyltransferase
LLLTIEKLIYGGDGLARLPADEQGRGKAVFIPFVLADEKLEATLIQQKSSFARARVNQIIEPSPQRVAPGCRYFAQCGGCHYQHASYEHQLEIKKEILRENLRRMAKVELPCEIEVHPSPPWNYRNRSRLQIRVAPEFALGYFKFGSHQVLPVQECPISSPLINRGIAAFWQLGSKGNLPDGLRDVEFFADAADARLLLTLGCTAEARRSPMKAWAEELQAAMSEIAGVTVFREVKPGAIKSRETKSSASGATDEILLALGDEHLTYQTPQAAYRVSAGSFFQSNRHLAGELVKIVTQGQRGEMVLDLYAGVGLFSTALAGDFRHIVAVEPSQTGAADLQYNLPKNGKAIQETAEQYLGEKRNSEVAGEERSGSEAALPGIPRKPDLVIVDPPRSGLGEGVARAVAGLEASRIAYVSCDPATLARDLVVLLSAGYRIDRAHMVDLFPQTYHMETVMHLSR